MVVGNCSAESTQYCEELGKCMENIYKAVKLPDESSGALKYETVLHYKNK